MIATIAKRACPALFVLLVILAASSMALAKGGSVIHLFAVQYSHDKTVAGSPTQPALFGGCGGKRCRDAESHQCRSLSDGPR